MRYPLPVTRYPKAATLLTEASVIFFAWQGVRT